MKKRRQVSSQKAASPAIAEKPQTSSPSKSTPQPDAPGTGEAPPPRSGKWLLLQVMAVVCVIVMGFWVRLEDLVPWNREPGKAFYAGQPLLTALDGYFYLTLARDLVEGNYHPIDEKRAVPDCPPRPEPPPLISFLTATAARVLPLSIDWIAVLLPTVFGVLIFFPLYGLGRFFGGPLMGTVAGLMGLLFPYFVYRSGLGWLDTDPLNVVFATAAPYFFLKFGVTSGPRRYYHLLAGMIICGLFLWWWDQTPHVVTIICLVPLAVALVFFYRPPGRERLIFFGVLFLGLLVVFWWKGTALLSQFITIIESVFGYISKESTGAFPNIGVSISEQVKPSLETMIFLSSGNIVTFAVAVCGFIWLVWRHWKHSLFLVVLVVLSAFAFFFARRFAIFCVPVAALGIAAFVSELWGLRRRFTILTYLTPLIVALLTWTLVEVNHAQTYWPKERPSVVSGLDLTAKKTPEDAVIWAWWDHGYTIPYYARRASVNDGSVHSGDRSVFNGLPLATDSERLSANFMQFWVARGMQGMQKVDRAMGDDQAKGYAFVKEILSVGPQKARSVLEEAHLPPIPELETTNDWLEFFFPSKPRPVFLFIDELLTRTSYWWFWFGTWDVERHDGIHEDYRIVTDIHEENGRLKGSDGVEIDMSTGTGTLGNQTVPLQEIAIWDGVNSQIKRFNHQSGVVFEASAASRLGAFMHKDMAPSVFNRLYLRQAFSREYFRPVVIKTPWYQLWEVRGDSWKASTDAP
jgi:hypothetical protein